MTPAQKAAWDLDEATISLIEDRFYFREICDDEKMTRFFQRTLDTVRDRYRQILRIETIKFDPLVSKYFEGEFTTDGSEDSMKMGTHNDTTENEGTNYQHQTNYEHTDNDFATVVDYEKTWGHKDADGEYSKSGSDSKDTNAATTGNTRSQHTTNIVGRTDSESDEHTEGSVDTSFIDRHALKQAPMSASGVGAGEGGYLTGLDFNYASMYEQNDHKANTTDNGTTKHTEGNATNSETNQGNAQDYNYNSTSSHELAGNSESGSNEDHDVYQDEKQKNYSDNRDLTTDGYNTVEGHTGGTNIVTGSNNEIVNASNYQIRHDRYAGRDNVLPQDALKAAMNYLQNYSTAFEWLCNKLEINFIGIYDI